MAADIQTTDKTGSLCLPPSFANATVIVEQISDTELRVRKTPSIPEDEVRFIEEEPRTPLSDRDRDIFLDLLDNPPPPNEALRKAMAMYMKQYG